MVHATTFLKLKGNRKTWKWKHVNNIIRELKVFLRLFALFLFLFCSIILFILLHSEFHFISSHLLSSFHLYFHIFVCPKSKIKLCAIQRIWFFYFSISFSRRQSLISTGNENKWKENVFSLRREKAVTHKYVKIHGKREAKSKSFVDGTQNHNLHSL